MLKKCKTKIFKKDCIGIVSRVGILMKAIYTIYFYFKESLSKNDFHFIDKILNFSNKEYQNIFVYKKCNFWSQTTLFDAFLLSLFLIFF